MFSQCGNQAHLSPDRFRVTGDMRHIQTDSDFQSYIEATGRNWDSIRQHSALATRATECNSCSVTENSVQTGAKHHPPALRFKCRAEYVNGEATLPQLHNKYGVPLAKWSYQGIRKPTASKPKPDRKCGPVRVTPRACA